MKPQALEILQRYHDKIIQFSKDGNGTIFNGGDLENLSVAKGIIDGRPFSTCCADTIANGMREVKNYYLKYLETNG